jgi:trimethylamine--corrinoid protein Co-methyltransferase
MRRNLMAGRESIVGTGLLLFSQSDLEQIHYATLEVMEESGIYVQGGEALDYFAGAGCQVNRETNIVKIPSRVVEDAIRSAPRRVLLAGRDPKHDIHLENGRVNFCPFGEGVMLHDPYTGERRPPTKQDKGNIARLVDSLDQYDYVENTVAPMDVNPKVASLHSYEVVVENTTKHVQQPAEDAAAAKILIKMAAEAVGGIEKLRDRPTVTLCCCPQSPLSLSQGTCEAIIEYARAGLPMLILSMALAGGTSPVTLAGTLVVHNAEVLSGIVLAQLVRKGTSVIYGSSTSILDLRRATATVGCPELGMLSAGVAKLAQYYLLPSYVAGS